MFWLTGTIFKRQQRETLTWMLELLLRFVKNCVTMLMLMLVMMMVVYIHDGGVYVCLCLILYRDLDR